LEEDTLERALPVLYHTRFAQRRPLGPNEGKAVTFTRWTSFGAAITPLVEGEVPAGQSLATSQVTITPERYGSYVYIGRVLGEQGIFNMLRDGSELLGEQAALTSDTLAREALAGGGTAQIADGVSLRGSILATNIVDEQELLKARQTLVKNKARPLDEAGGNFAFIFHPDVGYDLRNDAGLKQIFLHAAPRSDENPLFGHSVADVMGIRFYETQNGKIGSNEGDSNVDVYYSFLVGRGSYGIAGYGAMLADYVEGGKIVGKDSLGCSLSKRRF